MFVPKTQTSEDAASEKKQLLQQPNFPVAPDSLNEPQIKLSWTPATASSSSPPCLIYIVQLWQFLHCYGLKKCNDTILLKWSSTT